jgi:hypothetical protein
MRAWQVNMHSIRFTMSACILPNLHDMWWHLVCNITSIHMVCGVAEIGREYSRDSISRDSIRVTVFAWQYSRDSIRVTVFACIFIGWQYSRHTNRVHVHTYKDYVCVQHTHKIRRADLIRMHDCVCPTHASMKTSVHKSRKIHKGTLTLWNNTSAARQGRFFGVLCDATGAWHVLYSTVMSKEHRLVTIHCCDSLWHTACLVLVFSATELKACIRGTVWNSTVLVCMCTPMLHWHTHTPYVKGVLACIISMPLCTCTHTGWTYARGLLHRVKAGTDEHECHGEASMLVCMYK